MFAGAVQKIAGLFPLRGTLIIANDKPIKDFY
jgi:hypothetical protein